MNIDYEAIAVGAPKVVGWTPNAEWVKAIIEAYEAQKKAPEWVPLDLSTVKQGQEVRNKQWPETEYWEKFICRHGEGFITEADFDDFRKRGSNLPDWLMRAPKPKTVRVKVYHLGGDEYVASIGGEPVAYKIVGEGDIQVTP